MSGIKLFVGGLSYSTGAEVLGKLFETVGIVKSATIATNENNQSRGHGFVEMETPELALIAVNKLNGFVLEGRAIHVHVYRESPSEGGLGGRGRGRGRGAFGAGFQGGLRGGLRGRGGFSGGFSANNGFPVNTGGNFQNDSFQGGFRGVPAARGFRGGGFSRGVLGGSGRGRGVGGLRSGFGGGISGAGGFPARTAVPFVQRQFVIGGFAQRGRGGFGGGGGWGSIGGGFGGGWRGGFGGGFRGPSRGGFRRGFGGGGRGGGFAPRRPFDSNAPLSKTRVYVRNIPFDLSSQDLEAVFTEKGFNIKEVSIAQRRFNTSVNRGFGFVEFGSEEEQARALKELGTVTIKERPCQIMAARPIPERHVAGAVDAANAAAVGEGVAEGGNK